jgi:hypothetical protein
MGEFVFLLFLGLVMATLPDVFARELLAVAVAIQRFRQHMDGQQFFAEPDSDLQPVSDRALTVIRCCGVMLTALALAGLAGFAR